MTAVVRFSARRASRRAASRSCSPTARSRVRRRCVRGAQRARVLAGGASRRAAGAAASFPTPTASPRPRGRRCRARTASSRSPTPACRGDDRGLPRGPRRPARIVVIGDTPIMSALARIGGELGWRWSPPTAAKPAAGDLALVVAAHGRDELDALRWARRGERSLRPASSPASAARGPRRAARGRRSRGAAGADRGAGWDPDRLPRPGEVAVDPRQDRLGAARSRGRRFERGPPRRRASPSTRSAG